MGIWHRTGKFRRGIVLGLLVSWAVTGMAWTAPVPRPGASEAPGKPAELLWKFDGLGTGAAGVAVQGGHIYAAGMNADGQGVVFALDRQGACLWQTAYGPETRTGLRPGACSRPSPGNGAVYVLSGPGLLSCLDAQWGVLRWQADIVTRFGGRNDVGRYSESVLVLKDKIICMPGGPDAAVVALDPATNETVWTSRGFSDPAACGAATVFQFGKRTLVVAQTSHFLAGIDAQTGQVLWTHRLRTERCMHRSVVVRLRNRLYYTEGFGGGCGELRVSPDGSQVQPGWRNDVLDCRYPGVVLADGYLYGTGHAYSGLMCLDAKNGRLRWRSLQISRGITVRSGAMLYVYEESATPKIYAIRISPEAFRPVGFFPVPDSADAPMTVPVISRGVLYLRQGSALYAWSLAGENGPAGGPSAYSRPGQNRNPE